MAIGDPATRLANKINDLVEAKVKKRTKKSPVIKSGKVVKIDENGIPWVSVSGSDEATPVNGEVLANVKPGDSVSVNIENGKCNIIGNPGDPSIGSNEAKNVSNQEIKIAVEQEGTIGRAIDVESNKTINKVDGMISDQLIPVEEAIEDLDLKSGEDIRILRGRTVSSMSIAEEAKSVVDATNQHFWYDDGGAHVTEVTQEEWNSFPSGFNSLFNSLGLLLRKALNNIAAFTHNAVTFFDGNGNDETNITAFFGSNGAQIGRDDGGHIEINPTSLYLRDHEGKYLLTANLRNDQETGFGTISFSIPSSKTDGSRTVYETSYIIYDVLSAKDETTDIYIETPTKTGDREITFSTPPISGHAILVKYRTLEFVYDFGIGTRMNGKTVGTRSVVIGSANAARGSTDIAIGTCNEITGSRSIGIGNFNKIEYNSGQIVLGNYNVPDSPSKDDTTKHVLIVGNGNAEKRNNAIAIEDSGAIHHWNYASDYSQKIFVGLSGGRACDFYDENDNRVCQYVFKPDGSVGYLKDDGTNLKDVYSWWISDNNSINWTLFDSNGTRTYRFYFSAADGSMGRYEWSNNSWTNHKYFPTAPVTIANGGTGQTSANAAARALGMAKTAGDSITMSGIIVNGFLTNAKKSAYMTVPLPYRLYGVNSTTISGTVTVRGSGLYLFGSTSDTPRNLSALSPSVTAYGGGFVRIAWTGSAQADATNNSPISVNFNTLTITFH